MNVGYENACRLIKNTFSVFQNCFANPHLFISLCSYKLSFHQSLASFYSNRRGNRNIFSTFPFIYNFQSDIQELPQNNETDCRSFNCRRWSNELFAFLNDKRSVPNLLFDKTPRGYEVQCFNYYCNVVMHLLIKQFCFLLIDFKHIFLFYFDYCILYNKKLDQSNII